MCLEGCCRHHPGVPVFHDALKGWSCCSRRSTDFTEFLNIPGCTNGRHSNEKPPEPEKKPAAEVNCPEVFFFIFSNRPLCHFPTNYKKYKSVCNKVRNETRNLQREEQRQVACQCKENPKVFWWGTGVVVCLEQGASLHMAQLMPLPLTVSCFSKIQIGFTCLVPAHLGSPGKRAVKRVCVCSILFTAE